jgi:hypothetical protein
MRRDRKYILMAVAVLALAGAACRIPDITLRRMEVGPTVTEDIAVEPPAAAGTPEVEILMGAGELLLSPGGQDLLVEGVVTYNVEELAPTVVTDGNRVRVRQGDDQFDATIPDLTGDVQNTWDLMLGSMPLALTVNVGAALAELDLGGLSLTELTISQGASRFDLRFSEPNQVEMSLLRFNGGASHSTLTGLANANAAEIIFRGGAGSYTLEFTGELRQDLTVQVEAGLGEMVIIVPEDVAAEATFEGALTDVEAYHAWERSGNTYTLPGDGPQITFDIRMGAGSLELRNR